MQARYKAPFLHKAILIELLNTYRGEDLVEKKPQVSVFSRFSNPIISSLGYNTQEDSENWYLTVRDDIEEATEKQNIEAWVDLLCDAGEAGFTTCTNSLTGSNSANSMLGSKLCPSVFALRAYILNKVNEVCSTIENNKPQDAEQTLAFKIKQAIDIRIDQLKKFIEYQNEVISLSKQMKLSSISIRGLKINTTKAAKYEKYCEDMIEIAQRYLCYLGDYESIKLDKYQAITITRPKSIKELFPKFPPFYNLKEKLSRETEDKMRIELPLFLQQPYDAIFIRSKDSRLASENDKNAISNFEFKIMERIYPQVRFKTPLVSSPMSLSLPQRSTPLLNLPDDKKKFFDDDTALPTESLSEKIVIKDVKEEEVKPLVPIIENEFPENKIAKTADVEVTTETQGTSYKNLFIKNLRNTAATLLNQSNPAEPEKEFTEVSESLSVHH